MLELCHLLEMILTRQVFAPASHEEHKLLQKALIDGLVDCHQIFLLADNFLLQLTSELIAFLLAHKQQHLDAGICF